LQTLQGITTDKTSTLIFPIPIDLFEPFLKILEKDKKE
jgi:hypothetical protein